ncbi:hypothetical protein FACS1894177_06510 [Bacteroidia bacterium]|nr:hypothetical protein FACS1894177_06510 [Bacteroidia bacterium]
MAKRESKKTIINQLVVKAPNRKITDIGTWRTAIRNADAGRPQSLFDLYDDLLLDGVLYDAYDKRVTSITNAELIFQDKDGNDVPEMMDVIDTTGFEELERIILKSRFWGRSSAEFDLRETFRVDEIPPKNINTDKKLILINETDDTGIDYETDNRIVVFSNNKRDPGLFVRTAPLVIWKRGGFGDYAQWLEIFGMPQRIGKYSSYDPESRKLLEQALEKAGSAPYAVIPKESEVETVQNTGNGSSGTSYNTFRQACNEEILITILGQTLTTIQGEKGARSLGEVHRAVEEAKHKSDMRYTQRMLNTLILPVLESAGFPTSGGKFIFPKSGEPLSVSDITQLSKIIRIPARYIHDKYSIPVPDDGEEIAGDRARQEEEIDDTRNTGNNTGKKMSDRVKGFFVDAPAVMTGAFGRFTTKLIDSITGTINLAEQGEKTFRIDTSRLFEKAIREVYGDGADTPAINKTLFEITNNALQEGIVREFKGAGLEFGRKNQSFINEFKYNAAVFSAFKNHRQTQEIVSLLTGEDGNLRPFYEFRKLALKVSKDYNTEWLRTEYNTAVRAARAAVNWRKYLETKHLYPNLEYIESVAKQKRELHFEWAGTILPVEHPWWDDHLPPSDWNCQCSVRQTDKPATPVPEGESIPAFRNNPGKTAEMVNIKETAYYKHAENPEAILREAGKLIQRKVREWAKENLKGESVRHGELKEEINFSMKGIKEYLNQPHEFYNIKNEMFRDIKNILKNAAYKGITYYKGRKSHIFEVEIKGKKSYLIANENLSGEIFFYSITDNNKVLKGITKEKTD